ncbi:GHKL domain-containing protein [Mucilaginibacter daejeonensis]|uniref:sensor histidine kinase n=1 Tax=Mucilaginibacter daejeonensis TaxID=398049 RepID=UPI001D17C0F6|nr:ATP-binding protein [Mucilaginibacter daejeonensis]UEG55105.1 GHKL domain-containing protein [Mucilaginibacter daejeonensis]
MIQVTPEWLKGTEALKDVPTEQLQWLIDNCEHYVLKDGDHLFERDQPHRGTYYIITGKIRLYYTQAGVRREMATLAARSITGYLPYSRGKKALDVGDAIGETQIMTLVMDKQMELIRNHYELTQALVGVMSNRVRESTALLQQNEKMMALGKLSAGLAHELNNPAAAIVRNAASLREHLQTQPETFAELLAANIDVSKIPLVKAEIARILQNKNVAKLSLRQRSDLEDEFADWLDEHDIENGYEMAGNFVEQGFKCGDLDAIYQHMVPASGASAVFRWINDTLLSDKMVTDIHDSAQRIAGLISSIKNFTHMDRAPDHEYARVDAGIHNTLTMLGHKLKANNITVIEEFDPELPPVKILVGELNQVWTNLIDNAIDAMEANGKGELTIRTRKDKEFAEITITDDGPGIPDDVKGRIFDPFFTTKQMGKGTGLGLEVVQRIVKQQHNGTIKVNSKPGHTEFVVCIPIHGTSQPEQ